MIIFWHLTFSNCIIFIFFGHYIDKIIWLIILDYTWQFNFIKLNYKFNIKYYIKFVISCYYCYYYHYKKKKKNVEGYVESFFFLLANFQIQNNLNYDTEFEILNYDNETYLTQLRLESFLLSLIVYRYMINNCIYPKLPTFQFFFCL